MPDADNSTDGPVTISMDYMHMHERMEQYKEGASNFQYLVVVEHRHGRVWAYQTPNKGPHDEAGWLHAKLIQDWNACGFNDVRIQFETDQEFSIMK